MWLSLHRGAFIDHIHVLLQIRSPTPTASLILDDWEMAKHVAYDVAFCISASKSLNAVQLYLVV